MKLAAALAFAVSAALVHPFPGLAQTGPAVAAPGTQAAQDSGAPPPAAKKRTMFRDAGLKNPKCVLYDAARDRYIVSNVNGQPLQRDGNGFISLLAPDGSVIEEKWISSEGRGITLHAPKGMAIFENTLYVADINLVHAFDLETGKLTETVRVVGALFLNDIAVRHDGTLFITDSGARDVPGAIFAILPTGVVRSIAMGRELFRPSGIDLDSANQLIVATFGADRILRVSPGGQVLDSQHLERGRLDGLVVRQNDSRLVSSWEGERVVHVTKSGEESVVLDDVATPGAFDIDTRRKRLLVPLFRENRIVAASLE